MIKKLVQQLIVILLFTVGGCIFTYPFYSNGINYLVDQYRLKEMNQRNSEENKTLKSKMDVANKLITEKGIIIEHDPFDASQVTTNKLNIKDHLIGSVTIPKINMTVPLYDTLSNQILENGAGVLNGTSLPTGGKGNHSVISAHRGLAERELFRYLDELRSGDVFLIENLNETIAYEIFKVRTVKPEETDIFQLNKEEDLASLLTCTPYMINSHRLIVTGRRIEVTKALQKEVETSKINMKWQKIAVLAGFLLGLIMIVWLLFNSVKRQLLWSKKYTFTFYIKNKKFKNNEFILYQKGKKKPLKRARKILIVKSNAKGKVTIKDLPGSVYVLALKSKPEVRLGYFGVKKITAVKMSWLKDNKKYLSSSFHKKKWFLRLKSSSF